jgi:Phosphate-starvation-inducible E family
VRAADQERRPASSSRPFRKAGVSKNERRCVPPLSTPGVTVIIALEFRRTLLVVTERQQSIVHVRAVILIAMLAIVRKPIILDLASGGSGELFAFAAAILALEECSGLFATAIHATQFRPPTAANRQEGRRTAGRLAHI